MFPRPLSPVGVCTYTLSLPVWFMIKCILCFLKGRQGIRRQKLVDRLVPFGLEELMARQKVEVPV